MGKRIIVQARGRGGPRYRAKKKAFKYKLNFPSHSEGQGEVLRLLSTSGHSAPLAKVIDNKESFYIPACKGMYEGQKIHIGGKEVKQGNILKLKDIPIGTKIYCIESRPGDGGKFIKSSGSSAVVNKKTAGSVFIVLPSKKEKKINENCRAIIGIVAGHGRLDKPLVKAGKRHYIKKAKGKLWPRTSAIKMNAIDHPFGSGRGKNPKSKIAKRNAPPGAKVGLLRPRKTGKRK